MTRAFARQLEEHGSGAVQKSIRTLTRRLSEHIEKAKQIREAGRDAGSVEREISNFRAQIESAKRVLQETPR
jgi:hypothetical protein